MTLGECVNKFGLKHLMDIEKLHTATFDATMTGKVHNKLLDIEEEIESDPDLSDDD